MKEKNQIIPYIRNGFLIGLLFPILAIIICVFLLTPDNYEFSLSEIHKDFPLLWIIDSAPIVLGLISFFVGNKVNNENSKHHIETEKFNQELTDKNLQLENLITEKEVLLKEVHHRVKNNLQIITSLLSLQSSFISDEQSKALFRYSQYRINSMAVIHEMLYKSEDISKINYGDYAEKLISGLITSMKGTENNISFKFEIPDIKLNIDTAIPLGLLINEVITNSLKYGIEGDSSGEIYMKITRLKHNNYTLFIGDNGKGFSEEINFRNSNSLGLMLIHKLSIQLKGSIEKDNNKKGTNYILNFQEIEQTS